MKLSHFADDALIHSQENQSIFIYFIGMKQSFLGILRTNDVKLLHFADMLLHCFEFKMNLAAGMCITISQKY